MNRPLAVLRWTLSLPLAVLVGWLIWLALSAGLDAFGVEPPDWRFFLAKAYGYLVIGFLVAGIATKLAPSGRGTMALVMVGVSLGVAFVVALASPNGTAAGIVFGLALLAGAVGYALRFRGFTEAPETGG